VARCYDTDPPASPRTFSRGKFERWKVEGKKVGVARVVTEDDDDCYATPIFIFGAMTMKLLIPS
jgi:hypothetical protein